MNASLLIFSALALALYSDPLAAKTPAECHAEYSANRSKIEGAQTEPDFIAACQAGQEPVAGATSAARPAVPPAVAAGQPATPASAAGAVVKAPATP